MKLRAILAATLSLAIVLLGSGIADASPRLLKLVRPMW